MKKVDYIYQTVKNPHFVKNPGESAGFFKKTQKNPPGPGFFKILAGFANPACWFVEPGKGGGGGSL